MHRLSPVRFICQPLHVSDICRCWHTKFTGDKHYIKVVLFIRLYRVIQNDCRGFNSLSYTIHLRLEYIVAPMDQEILEGFFCDVRCAVVMHFSAWSAVY